DKWAKDREAGVDFLQTFTAWEAIVAEYTDQSGEVVSDNVRVSVLLEHAPEAYREALCQAPEDVKLTFAAARSHIRGCYNQGRTFNAVDTGTGFGPTQVGAVTYGGKAGGKVGGKLGKHGKKGGKCNGKGDKAKRETKRVDCFKRLHDEKASQQLAGGARAVSDAAAPSASGAVAAAAGYHGEACEDGEAWVFAITARGQGAAAKVGGSVLIDSGSDDHLCRPKFVPDATAEAEGAKATADFPAADVNDDLLSMGKLPSSGAWKLPPAGGQEQQAQRLGLQPAPWPPPAPQEGGAAPAQPQAQLAAQPAPAEQPIQAKISGAHRGLAAPGLPAASDQATGAPALAAQREISPAAEAAEGKRARVAAAHAVDAGSLDDAADVFWEGAPEEAQGPSESMFDGAPQDGLDSRLTEKHLQSLLDHRVGEDIQEPEAARMKHVRQRKIRFVCRAHRRQEWRDDLFTQGSAPISQRLIDVVALERSFKVMALDATGAFYQAPETEGVAVDPPPEYLERLSAQG
ncbi:unnamed protein product, partial [Prorocentrum cordatum]